MVEECISFLQFKANEKGVQLSLELPILQPVSVTSDPNRVMQIVINLLSNAVKYTEKGFVRVTLSASDD